MECRKRRLTRQMNNEVWRQFGDKCCKLLSFIELFGRIMLIFYIYGNTVTTGRVNTFGKLNLWVNLVCFIAADVAREKLFSNDYLKLYQHGTALQIEDVNNCQGKLMLISFKLFKIFHSMINCFSSNPLQLSHNITMTSLSLLEIFIVSWHNYTLFLITEAMYA